MKIDTELLSRLNQHRAAKIFPDSRQLQWGEHPIAPGRLLRVVSSVEISNPVSTSEFNRRPTEDAVIDYRNGTLDTDHDGLPDWWESRYFGNITNALPQAQAANHFSNLQCYWLGLDPTAPNSIFRAQASIQSGTGFPQVMWSSVGGKSYAVEYADTLNPPGAAFTQAVLVTETNVLAGVASTETFVDNYTLTGAPPTANTRFYRVKLVGP